MPYTAEVRKGKIKKFITFLKENREDIAAQELDEILEEIAEEQKQFVLKAEFRELVVEMRQGFQAMDRRFAELLHYMDKRFEDMNKRFEDINKRFEDMNNNFNFFRWFLSIFITVLFGLNSLFFYLVQDKNQQVYHVLQKTLEEIKAEIKTKK